MEQKISKLAAVETDEEPADRSLRALLALEAIVCAGEPLSLAQLADRLNTPKATLLRMLSAMERQRFLLREVDEKTYLPGPRTHALGFSALRNEVLLRRHRLIMQELVRDLGETCNLTTVDRDRVIYVDRVETHEPLRLHVEPGTHVPLHCTASGKLFLARMAPEQRRAMLERLPLTRQTDRTLTDIGLLETELERIRARGVGIDSEEFVRGMVAVSVPIEDDAGRCVAALACHAPTARRSLSEMMECVPRLQRAADSLAQSLELRLGTAAAGAARP